MLGFTYYTPTKVAFGKGSVERVGELMKQFGGKKGKKMMARMGGMGGFGGPDMGGMGGFPM